MLCRTETSTLPDLPNMDLENAFSKFFNDTILLIMNNLHNPSLSSTIPNPPNDYILKLIIAALINLYIYIYIFKLYK